MTTRSSVLVFSFLLVAPCASMKMKAAGGSADEGKEPMDLQMPNCIKMKYNQLSEYNTKSCYVYHTFMGYHPETGQVQRSPEMYGFENDMFILDGISPTRLWKWNQQRSSWAGSFVAETADGANTELNCNKRTSTGGVMPGFLDSCPHGPIWQAEFNYNRTAGMLAMLKSQIKHDKKVLHVVAKEGFKEAKANKMDLKDAMADGKRLKKLASDVKSKKKDKKKK